jgi:hypothetical protein
VIVYATGFHLTGFPFLDRKYFNWDKDNPGLYLNVFHPGYDNLFVIGLFQTNTGNWPLMDYQSQLASRFIHAQRWDAKKADAFRKLKAGARPNLTSGIRFGDSPKFAIEVEHYSYRAKLKKLIARMGAKPPRMESPAPSPDGLEARQQDSCSAAVP